MRAIGLVVVVAGGARGSLVIAGRVAAWVAIFCLRARRGGLWLGVGAGGGQVDDARARRGPHGGRHGAQASMVDDGSSVGACQGAAQGRTGGEQRAVGAVSREGSLGWAVWCRRPN